jgi:hypothetical protein
MQYQYLLAKCQKSFTRLHGVITQGTLTSVSKLKPSNQNTNINYCAKHLKRQLYTLQRIP